MLDVLLEEDGAESRVESTDTLVLGDLAEARDQTRSKAGLSDETDTGSLERAESDVSEELSGRGRREVDSGAVVGSGLIAELVDPLLLEEFVTSELEGALEEVTGGGGTETSEESTGTVGGDDLLEGTDHALVVGDGVELDAGLDAEERDESMVIWMRKAYHVNGNKIRTRRRG